MLTVSTCEEMCRVLQFLDHFIQHHEVREVCPPAAVLGNCISDGRLLLKALHVVN